MTCFPCSYLKGEIELSAEREQHILERHPELLPNHRHWSQRWQSLTRFAEAPVSVVLDSSPGGTLTFGKAGIWLSSWSVNSIIRGAIGS